MVYEVSTDCLVDFCTLKWYVEAKDDEDAWMQGYGLAYKCNIADEGGVEVRPYEGQPKELNKLYEV